MGLEETLNPYPYLSTWDEAASSISANSKYLAGQGEPLIRGEGGIGFEFLRMAPEALQSYSGGTLIQEGLV